jgi:hypothetical protein
MLHGITASNSSLLVVTGKAGCGKSALAAHILKDAAPNRYIEGALLDQHVEPAVLFFFFQRSNQESENTATSALRTFAYQLVRQSPQPLPILLTQHDILSVRGAFIWSWDNISSIITKMLRQANQDSLLYIILDAVDKCKSTSRMLVLD